MGVDLRNSEGAQQRLSGTGWSFYLNLAERYGWEPTGTLPPTGVSVETWDRSYEACAGQVVSAADAASMANALKRALADPNRTTVERAVAVTISNAMSAAIGRAISIDPPSDHSMLENLVAFCSAGSFFIE